MTTNRQKPPIRRIAITGALGHIGSRFIHSIKPGRFDQVMLIDNMLTQRYCSLFNLPAGVPFEFHEADICTESLNRSFAGMDAVIHLAAITNAAASFDKPEEVERVNYEGTVRVAQAAASTGSRLINLSTTSVYGVSARQVDETCPVEELKPQSPYASTKLKAEQLLAEMGVTLGLRSVTCRFGTIYGVSPGMRFHTAINKFVWQACLGQPITVWRSAMNQHRPYLDLGDAVRAIWFILDEDVFTNDVYNVVTDNLTVAEVVDAIREYMPSLQVELVESSIMNQLSYSVASQRFRKLGFVFEGSLSQGIRESVRMFGALAEAQINRSRGGGQ